MTSRFGSALGVLLLTLGSMGDAPAQGALSLSLDLDSGISRTIGRETLPVRQALSQGLSIEASSPTTVVLGSVLIADGRVVSTYKSRPFKLGPGTTRVPADQLPGDEFLPGNRFTPGDVYIPGDMYFPIANFERFAQSMARSGAFGTRGVDWRNQQVLVLAVMPSDARAAAGAQTRAVAFVMNADGKSRLPRR